MLKALLFLLTLFCSISFVRTQKDYSFIQQLIFEGSFPAAKSKISAELGRNNIAAIDKAQLHHLLGDMFKIEGNMDAALHQWTKAAKIRSKIYSSRTDYHHAWKYAHLSNFHHEKIHPKLALAYADSCLSLIQNLSVEQKTEIEIYKVWNLLTQSYKSKPSKTKEELLNTYRKVISQYQRSIEFQQINKTPEHILANTYHLLGNAYLDVSYYLYYNNDSELGNKYREQAKKHYSSAIGIWRKLYGQQHYELARTEFVSGLLSFYLDQHIPGQLEESLSCFRKAKEAYGLDDKANLNAIERIPNKEDALMCLKYYTQALLKLHDLKKQKSLLDEAKQINKVALELWNQIHLTFQNENTNQNLAIYQLTPQLEQIAILMRDKEIKNADRNAQFFTINQQLKYYDLFKSSNSKKEVKLEEIRNKLNPNQVFLDIHHSDINKETYFLFIAQNSTFLKKVDETFLDTLRAFKKSILDIDFGKFTSLSTKAFKAYFGEDLKGLKEIIICPDAFFSTISFDAFLASPKNIGTKDYRKLDYLIHHVRMNQVLSPHYFTNQIKTITSNVRVIAPSFTSDLVSDLPFSKELATTLNNKYGFRTFLGEDGKSNSLLQNKGDVLHLSTHSIIGEDPSLNQLVFNDKVVYQGDIKEVSKIPIFLILNSCNSGLGRELNGDGMNGFVREFHKRGTKTSISNLWDVDDHASNQIFELFYQFLNEGIESSLALRNVKLEQIKNAPNSELGAPYYWAGHKFTGVKIGINQNNVSFMDNLSLWLILLILCTPIFGVIYWIIKAKKHNDKI